MTIADGQADDGGDALTRAAAHWFARMRGPDADAVRAAFEAWLAQGPEHRAAYNRAAEIFAMGKLLAEPDQPVVVPAPARSPRLPAVALAVAAACTIGIGGWALLEPRGPVPERREAVADATGHRTLSTLASAARTVRLDDGSTVRLGDRTVLEVDLSNRQRGLRLLQGQARFEVAHEQRAFIVFAGGGSVTARGTIFEVALTRLGKVDVRLVQGAIDVALPRAAANTPPTIRKLSSGQGLSFAAQPVTPALDSPPASPTVSSETPRDFEATPVNELVALANHGAARPIRLADAALGAERVSGRFRIDDTELLARRLGALFGRNVDAADRRAIVLGLATVPTSGADAIGVRNRAEGSGR